MSASQPDIRTVPVPADVLQAAAQLVADAREQAERAERRGYSTGWRSGRADGYRLGYADGYRSGLDIGTARALLAMEAGWPPDLRPRSRAYELLRSRTELDDRPCRAGCGRCSRCIRAASVVVNLATYGQADYPGRVA